MAAKRHWRWRIETVSPPCSIARRKETAPLFPGSGAVAFATTCAAYPAIAMCSADSLA